MFSRKFKWKKVIATTAMALLLPAFAHAKEYKWDNVDKVMLGSIWSLYAVDMMQTQATYNNPDIRNLPNNMRIRRGESNPVINSLGKDAVIPYFISVGILTYVIADYLSPKWRKAFLTGALTIQVFATSNNAGIKIGGAW